MRSTTAASTARALIGVGVIALAGMVPYQPGIQEGAELAAGPVAPAVRQTPEEALAQDLALVAEARGWTVEQAAARHRAAEIIGRIAVKVQDVRPGAFVGSALAADPDGAPSLYIKGRADEFVNGLVKAAGIPINVVDNQPFSFEQLEERKRQVHDALVAQGFSQVSTGVNITGRGVIRAGVFRTPGVTDDRQTILAALPASLRASVSLTVNHLPIAAEDAAFGGMRTRATSTGFVCTSGWTVRHLATLAFGVTDAGHCGSMNRIVDPTTGNEWAMTFKSEHLAGYGDVEWFTTTQIEEGLFYADATHIRNVMYLERRAGISELEPICLYGRSSNVRNCTLEVQDVSQRCTNAGITYDRMVLMNGDIGAGGDSGGGWSFDYRAYGGHHGPCGGVPGRDSFSVADLFDEALGVAVQIYE